MFVSVHIVNKTHLYWYKANNGSI